METLSEKNEAKNSARDGLGIEDGSEVVCLRCSKEFMFFQRRRGLGLMLNELCIELSFNMSYQFMILVCCCA